MVSQITVPYPPFTLMRTRDFKITVKGPVGAMTKEQFVTLQHALSDFQRLCAKADEVKEFEEAAIVVGEDAKGRAGESR